jgi:hypothetical protein
MSKLFRQRTVHDLAGGKADRDEGLERVTSGEQRQLFLIRARTFKMRAWVNTGWPHFCPEDGRTYRVVAADDIRLAFQKMSSEKGWPLPRENRIWGSVFKEKGWERVGTRKSAIRERHAGDIGLWTYLGAEDDEDDRGLSHG